MAKRGLGPESTVADVYFGGRAALGDLGIEVEVEFADAAAYDRGAISGEWWRTIQDGSLRSGLEYVLSTPVPFNSLSEAITEFSVLTREKRFRDSLRTSVHIHVNARPISLQRVAEVAAAFWLIEDILVATQGERRTGNLFCLRATDASSIVSRLSENIRSGFTGPETLFVTREELFKYSALNFASLPKYGSLEFRFLRGMTDPNEIEAWARAFYNLVRGNYELRAVLKLAQRKSTVERERALSLLVGPEMSRAILQEYSSDILGLMGSKIPGIGPLLAALEKLGETTGEWEKPPSGLRKPFFTASSLAEDPLLDERPSKSSKKVNPERLSSGEERGRPPLPGRGLDGLSGWERDRNGRDWPSYLQNVVSNLGGDILDSPERVAQYRMSWRRDVARRIATEWGVVFNNRNHHLGDSRTFDSVVNDTDPQNITERFLNNLAQNFALATDRRGERLTTFGRLFDVDGTPWDDFADAVRVGPGNTAVPQPTTPPESATVQVRPWNMDFVRLTLDDEREAEEDGRV